LDCISLTSCRIRFTAGLLRLNLPAAAIASAAGDPASPPSLTGAGIFSLRIGNCREQREDWKELQARVGED
jgi:hypothetical protein